LPLPQAAITHLGAFLPLMAIGFVVGVYGHIVRSRTLILAGIIVIALVSMYFLASGEVQTF
jgi:hypothetical protein